MVMAKVFRATLKSVALLLFVLLSYFCASMAGAIFPAEGISHEPTESEATHRIYLVTTTLHADIALPFDEDLLTKFPHLANAGLPLDHPNLRYLLFGWGSKAFYTTAGSYSDITAAAAFKAITGDDAVLRVSASGPLQGRDDVLPLTVSEGQLQTIKSSMSASFENPQSAASHLKEASIGPNDAFFKAIGHFNILNPCNQWVNRVLRQAGVALGAWTPTTHSLRLSLTHYQSLADQE